MSEKEVISVPGRTANTLAAEIVALNVQAGQILISNAIEVGRRLVEAKAMVGHGEWGSYVEQLCGMSHRHANNCMKVFREWEANPNSQALANFSFTNAVRLLSMPEEDREVVLQDPAAPDMSSRELDRLAKELAEERKARAAAEKGIADAEAKVKAAEAKAKPPKHWQTELDRANSRAKQLEKDLKAAQKSKGASAEEVERIRAEVFEQAQAEVAEQLRTAKAQADAYLQQAKEAQEAAAAAVQDQQAAAKKQAILADSNVVNLNAVCDQIKTNLNVAKGYLMKIRMTDPAMADKLQAALVKLLDIQKEAFGGGEHGV